jgi:hypothetical protein
MSSNRGIKVFGIISDLSSQRYILKLKTTMVSEARKGSNSKFFIFLTLPKLSHTT